MNKIFEDLLSFVWQYRKLPLELTTTDGQKIEILHPGQINTDSGPDFFGAKIKIDDTVWAGNVEMHVKTSHWLQHGHQNDKAYDSVILHVVYEHDNPHEMNKYNFPVLELKPFISKELTDNYYGLIASSSWIPCEKNLKSVEQITIKPWLSKITLHRLESKTQSIREILAATNMDWETSFFRWFSSCFGFKLNNNAFHMLAHSIPFKVLMKHQDNLFQMEALLFGQAGLLLNMYQDTYAKNLKKEYDFLALKYQLMPLDPKVWKFMRTRPGNFPTVRISQLAGILTKINNLLSEMFGDVNPQTIKNLLKSEASSYWHAHYNFDRPNDAQHPKHLGNLAINNLTINAIVPFVFLYGQFHDNEKFKNAAIQMLENIPPEENHILKKWKTLHIVAENASESQALIELYNSYCQQKKCLSCSIGASLLLDVS